ncbi:RNA methyltransferase [Chromobacterium sp. IIBBL 290-4]|uniref:TrmH family RNA methyltransferase n=1 Tax=Chromobacterium sp. IIBBL 290-4 TaxID=2953890 RepID=UPI0020B8FA92|nr:RNA methyltransferase [Chromobacterium sp. IIBBL 290-4]UTH73866.1 RNA methyltransferase [Chromobacterium sp. IIBBL 290-4]
MHYIAKSITSPHNDEVKALARLVQSSRDRRKEGVMVLEGIHLLESWLQAGGAPSRVYLNEAAQSKHEVTQLLERLPAGTVVVSLPEAVMAKATALASAAELLALCPRPQPAEPDAAAARVMLEDIQDPGNLGTILRTAAAAGVYEIFLSKGCVDVFSPKVLRSGMGAHFALNIHEHADLAAELQGFAGRKLVTHLEGSSSLYGHDLTGPLALVFGNEGAGVSDGLLRLADARIRIPMPGHAESLNVAMAATVCLFERVRQQEARP